LTVQFHCAEAELHAPGAANAACQPSQAESFCPHTFGWPLRASASTAAPSVPAKHTPARYLRPASLRPSRYQSAAYDSLSHVSRTDVSSLSVALLLNLWPSRHQRADNTPYGSAPGTHQPRIHQRKLRGPCLLGDALISAVLRPLCAIRTYVCAKQTPTKHTPTC